MQFKYFLTTLFGAALAHLSIAQSTCATATQIDNLPYTTPGLLASETTCGAGNNYTKADKCGNRFMGDEEFMYAYTPAVNECVNLTVTPSGITNDAPTALFVTEGCPDDPNGKCMAQFINTTNDALPKPSIITNLQLEGGKTYYFQVTAESECFEFTFDATIGNGCAPDPTGYDCDDADDISALPYNYNGTTCNKTSILNVGNECYSSFYSGTAYIFKYTPADTECIEITGRSQDQTMRFSMHSECPTLTDTTCMKSRYFYTWGDRTYYETLDSGKTYYFVANSTSTAPGCSDYSFEIREISDEGTTCELAYTLNAPATTFGQHTTQCKGDFYNEDENCSTSAFYFGGNEVLYKYESAGNECVVASAINMSSYGNIQLFQGCPKPDTSNLMARDDRCGFRDPKSVTIEYTFSEPGTYYFLVSGRHYKSNWSDTYYDFNYDFQFSTSTLDDIGKDCANADTLASTLPSRKNNLSVQCKGDDYQEDVACNKLIDGADYVMVYTAPETFCGSVMARNTSGKGGITLMSGCPGSAGTQCLGSVGAPTLNCDSIYLDYTFQEGETYYIIASGNGGNFFSFDIEVQKAFNTIDGCATCVGDACVECENSNFEKSTLVNWTGRNGTYANPGLNAGFNEGYINDLESGHTIVNGGLDDPMVGPLVKTSGPLGGRYSLRLGNYISGGKGEQISFDINVTPDTKNFFYYYAVVFEDPPGHDETDQPFFGVEMVDGDGNPIGCATYQVRSNNAEGFNEVGTIPNDRNIASVKYKDWSLVAVPLDNYMGQTVTITFTATDCGLSGHMGYAYVDAFCGDLNIVPSGGASALCPGESVTLKAPDGFADYLWNTGEDTQEITVNAAGNYSVLLTPFSENPVLDCSITLEYEVEVSPIPVVEFVKDDGCNDAFIAFASTSSGGEPGLGIASYYWDFGDGSTSSDSAMMHEFPGPGTYTVNLKVVNDNGCEDNLSKDVTIDPYTTLAPLNAQDTLRTCLMGQVEFTSDALNDVSYSWTGPNGLAESANNFFLNTTDIIEMGWYNLKVVSTLDPCVVSYDSTYLYIEVVPELNVIQDTTICFSDSIFEVYASGGVTYEWIPNARYEIPTDAITTVNMPYSDSVLVKFGFELCPDSIMGSFITVDRPVEMLQHLKDTSICLGEPFDLESTALPADYLMWITPNQDSVFANPYGIENSEKVDSGNYKLIAYLGDNYYCPFDSISLNVSVLSLPNLLPSASPNPACPGTEVSVAVSGAHNYVWFNANSDFVSDASSFDSTFSQSEWFYVEGIDQFGCLNSDSVEVNVLDDFEVDLGPDLKRCKGDNAVVTINSEDYYANPSSILWSTGASSESITVADEGVYWVDVNINGCINRDSVYLTIQDPASFTLGENILKCQGEVAVIDLSSYTGDITWNDGSRDKIKTISYPGGSYSVEIVSGQCVLKDTIEVDFQDQHSVVVAADTVVCEGEILRFSTTELGTNIWFVNGKVEGNQDVELSAPGVYEIVLQNDRGVCSARDTNNSEIQAIPVGILPSTVSICEFDSILVDATIANGDSYLWNDGDTSPIKYLKTVGDHTVSITSGACTIIDKTTLNVTVLPVPDLGGDTTVCSINNLILSNNTSGTQQVNWYFNNALIASNQNSISVNQAGQYVLEVGQGTCFNTDTINVMVDANPSLNLGSDTALCPQQILQLSSLNPMYNNTWQDGSTAYTHSVSADGIYYVDVVNGMCKVSDTIVVSYINVQVPDLGTDTALCQGQRLILRTQTIGFDSLVWNDNSNLEYLDVGTTGRYYVDVFFAQCKVSDTVDVDVLAIPTFDLGSDITVCEGSVVKIGTSLSYVHSWSTGASTDSIAPILSGNYSLTLSNQHCTFSDDVNVTFLVPPVVDLGPDLLRCHGETDELFGPAGNYTYAWNQVIENRNKTISATGTYVLVVSDGVCTRSDTMFAEYTIPTDPNLPPLFEFCSTDNVQCDANVGVAAYKWNTGETTPTIILDSTGQYFVEIVQGGCINKYNTSALVTSNPILDLGPDVTVCADETVDISTDLVGYQTKWSNGELNPEITVSVPGLYSVTVTDGPCVVQDQVQVFHNPLPVIPKESIKICPKDSLLLDYSNYASQIWWSDGLNSLTRFVFPGTDFDLVVESEHGCRSNFNISAKLNYDCPDPIYVPSAFTPDGDGINDEFKPVMPGVQMLSISVFNRWGELVYETTTIEEGWKGFYLNEKAKSDVYVWRMKYIDKYEKERIAEGKVNLLR
jgi:gliding motility-associated-like protein